MTKEAEFSPTQEVRFALVMYGGSSLCIYMNGVAQEFLHLVRATAPAAPLSTSPTEAPPLGDDAGTECVYRKLGQLLSYGDMPKTVAPAEDDPITTRFVVDIISGSSAGGINGVFLAKALSNDQDIGPLKNLWIEEGDFAKLLNDGMAKDTIGLPVRKPPDSLMSGYRMYRKLLDAFDGMGKDPPAGTESRLVEELDLAVTTTDLRGLPLPIKLYDSVIMERRHRNVFRLKYRTEGAAGRSQNDFVEDNNPGLAFVARCTSSFPLVFEPMVLNDVDAVLDGTGRHQSTKVGASVESRWNDVFFPDYKQAGDPYRHRSFGDGGDIDNKPFSYAIQNLSVRRSTVPVNRKLVYVEPDPGRQLPEAAVTARINTVDSLAKAASLPRVETIREDLDRVREHNEAAKRVSEVVATVEDALRLAVPRPATQAAGVDAGESAGAPAAPAEPHTEEQTTAWIEERGATARARGLSYMVYHRLKVQQAVGRLGLLLARAFGHDDESDRSRAVRTLVGAWVDGAYADPFKDEDEDSPGQTENQFLLDFDLEFRMRRINFVERRADELLCDNPRAVALLKLATGGISPTEGKDDFEKSLRQAKRDLNAVFVGLRKSWKTLGTTLAGGVQAVGITPDDLDGILVAGTPGAGDPTASTPEKRAASLLADPVLRARLIAVTAEVKGVAAAAFIAAAGQIDTVLGGGGGGPSEELGRRALRFFFDQFEDYDMATLPLLSALAGDANQVDILRVSPYDATSLVSEEHAADKLGGTRLGHYGAFLKDSWRRNDVMWGRLDTAERIITALLPVDNPQREALLVEAQERILAEELGRADVTKALSEAVTAGTAMPDATKKLVREAVGEAMTGKKLRDNVRTNFTLPPGPEPQYSLEVASRGARVMGDILQELSRPDAGTAGADATGPAAQYAALNLPGRLLAGLGRFVWGLVEISVPGTLRWRVARYWLQLLAVVELFLIVAGIVLNQRAAVRLGWLTLFITLFLGLTKTLVGELLRSKQKLLRTVVAVVLIAVLGLALFGGVRVTQNARARACRSEPDSLLRKASPFSCPSVVLGDLRYVPLSRP
jgi:patatin-related protein